MAKENITNVLIGAGIGQFMAPPFPMPGWGNTGFLNYFNQSLDLIDKDGLIVIDNVLWRGEIINEKKQDKLTVGIREFNSYVNSNERIENLIIPVGDGLSVCRKL